MRRGLAPAARNPAVGNEHWAVNSLDTLVGAKEDSAKGCPGTLGNFSRCHRFLEDRPGLSSCASPAEAAALLTGSCPQGCPKRGIINDSLDGRRDLVGVERIDVDPSVPDHLR